MEAAAPAPEGEEPKAEAIPFARRAQAQLRVSAAVRIQNWWIARRSKTVQWFLVKDSLRKTFLDEEAKNAGAEQNPFYSDAALAAREALRVAPEVTDALKEAWKACAQCCGDDKEALTRDDYFTMCRKLYLSQKIREKAADIDPQEAIEAAGHDWAEDAKGRDELDEEAFGRCWFQLADVHTDSVDAAEYAAWTLLTVDMITHWDEINTTRRWRTDADMLRQVRSSAKKVSHKFISRLDDWCDKFSSAALTMDDYAELTNGIARRRSITNDVGGGYGTRRRSIETQSYHLNRRRSMDNGSIPGGRRRASLDSSQLSSGRDGSPGGKGGGKRRGSNCFDSAVEAMGQARELLSPAPQRPPPAGARGRRRSLDPNAMRGMRSKSLGAHSAAAVDAAGEEQAAAAAAGSGGQGAADGPGGAGGGGDDDSFSFSASESEPSMHKHALDQLGLSAKEWDSTDSFKEYKRILAKGGDPTAAAAAEAAEAGAAENGHACSAPGKIRGRRGNDARRNSLENAVDAIGALADYIASTPERLRKLAASKKRNSKEGDDADAEAAEEERRRRERHAKMTPEEIAAEEEAAAAAKAKAQAEEDEKRRKAGEAWALRLRSAAAARAAQEAQEAPAAANVADMTRPLPLPPSSRLLPWVVLPTAHPSPTAHERGDARREAAHHNGGAPAANGHLSPRSARSSGPQCASASPPRAEAGLSPKLLQRACYSTASCSTGCSSSCGTAAAQAPAPAGAEVCALPSYSSYALKPRDAAGRWALGYLGRLATNSVAFEKPFTASTLTPPSSLTSSSVFDAHRKSCGDPLWVSFRETSPGLKRRTPRSLPPVASPRAETHAGNAAALQAVIAPPSLLSPFGAAEAPLRSPPSHVPSAPRRLIT